MLRAFKKEIAQAKENVRNATRILDKKLPLEVEERNYIIDILIQSNNMIEKLEREVAKNENKLEAANRKDV
jgi:hypothetical protein